MAPPAGRKIWVDADATPRAVKEILWRAAQKRAIDIVVVANRPLAVPRSPRITTQVVARGFDVADEAIIAQVSPGDLVISGDIPLAAAVVERGAICVDPRGAVIDAENARSRLMMRDFTETLRESGVPTGGPRPHSDRDTKRFADALDRWLTTGRVG